MLIRNFLKGDIFMSLPYGFMLAPDGNVSVDQEKANTVRTIYQQYLSGMSLKGIANFLFIQGIPSPRGEAQWTQAVINDLLSNQRYIGSIVSFDEFFMAQSEKGKRLSEGFPLRERLRTVTAYLGSRSKRTSIWPQCSKVFMIRRLIPQFNGSISDIVSRIKWYGTRWNSILDAVMMGGIVCRECSSSATGNAST